MNPLVIPTVNLNGTACGDLVQQQVNVIEALADLLKVMSEAYPHGRDYQLAPDTYPAARAAWEERGELIGRLHREITIHAFAIDQQGKE